MSALNSPPLQGRGWGLTANRTLAARPHPNPSPEGEGLIVTIGEARA
jgi:hypothetical protein